MILRLLLRRLPSGGDNLPHYLAFGGWLAAMLVYNWRVYG